MKKYVHRVIMLCFLNTAYVNNLFGQAPGDSSYLQSALTQTVANYNRSIGQQSRLYNGPEYELYNRSIKGNALFPLDAQSWVPGVVYYDGITYKDVPMMYDIYKDVLVAMLYNRFSAFTLLSERVHDFTLSNHHFVRIDADSLNAASTTSGITTGFYDQLYGGKIEVLAKRIKTIQNSTNVTAIMETYFLEKNEYYLKKGNNYYSVGSQSSFLKVLKDKKSILQQYIREHKIRFRNDPEGAMASIANYYDHLTN
jgi:hypothetical protein